jgi:tripeptidyl-peptidase I
LIAAGKPTIGFANPFIYQHPQLFNDITSGYNPGCGTQGFAAEKGWDPVTGFGTPNYQKMLNAWMNAS